MPALPANARAGWAAAGPSQQHVVTRPITVSSSCHSLTFSDRHNCMRQLGEFVLDQGWLDLLLASLPWFGSAARA
jgi:hypothetical protein